MEGSDAFGALFAEELGLVLEVAPEQEAAVLAAYRDAGIYFIYINFHIVLI